VQLIECFFVCAGIHVSYYAEHRGHDNDVGQQMSHDHRAQIADTLSLGIAFDDVLDSTQLSSDNTSVSCLHFVSKQNLQNITHEFGLTSDIQYANDADSVLAWAINQQGSPDPMARHMKFPGAEDTECGLGEHDFMLVITSAAQIARLQQLFLTAPWRNPADQSHARIDLLSISYLQSHRRPQATTPYKGNRYGGKCGAHTLRVLKETCAIGLPMWLSLTL